MIVIKNCQAIHSQAVAAEEEEVLVRTSAKRKKKTHSLLTVIEVGGSNYYTIHIA